MGEEERALLEQRQCRLEQPHYRDHVHHRVLCQLLWINVRDLAHAAYARSSDHQIQPVNIVLGLNHLHGSLGVGGRGAVELQQDDAAATPAAQREKGLRGGVRGRANGREDRSVRKAEVVLGQGATKSCKATVSAWTFLPLERVGPRLAPVIRTFVVVLSALIFVVFCA